MVALIALVGNRIIAVLVGLWFHLHPVWLLGLLLFLDVLQIPFFYWLYENSARVLARLPRRFQSWFNRDWSHSSLGRWARSLGNIGVMLVAALPTFGGGMWSAIFLAYGLGIRKRTSYCLLTLGSFLSYLTIYWVGDALVTTVRYFGNR